MPKRTLSLGATVCGIAHSGSGSRKIVLAERVAPAAVALSPRKFRREVCITPPILLGNPLCPRWWTAFFYHRMHWDTERADAGIHFFSILIATSLNKTTSLSLWFWRPM